VQHEQKFQISSAYLLQCASAGAGPGGEDALERSLHAEPAALAFRAEAPESSLQVRRVLVVEDNRDAAESLRMLLELRGHDVRVAHTGTDGVEAAHAWQPEVVVCDIGLPGLDGYGVARQIRRNPSTAGIRLIALTGYGQLEDRRRSREAGFDEHLTKPAEPETLQQLIERD
jgi:CheY-like chemotaxis protein